VPVSLYTETPVSGTYNSTKTSIGACTSEPVTITLELLLQQPRTTYVHVVVKGDRCAQMPKPAANTDRKLRQELDNAALLLSFGRGVGPL